MYCFKRKIKCIVIFVLQLPTGHTRTAIVRFQCDRNTRGRREVLREKWCVYRVDRQTHQGNTGRRKTGRRPYWRNGWIDFEWTSQGLLYVLSFWHCQFWFMSVDKKFSSGKPRFFFKIIVLWKWYTEQEELENLSFSWDTVHFNWVLQFALSHVVIKLRSRW